MTALPVRRVVLYKHGVGYFEREGRVEGDADAVADVQAGRGSRRAQVAHRPRPRRRPRRLRLLRLDQAARTTARRRRPVDPRRGQPRRPAAADQGGAPRRRCPPAGERVEGVLLGVDTERTPVGRRRRPARPRLAAGDDGGGAPVRPAGPDASWRSSTRPCAATSITPAHAAVGARRRTRAPSPSSPQGEGERGVRLSYTLEAPVWKATYRILLGEEGQPPLIQGWAVVDNTQDEDWENVELSLSPACRCRSSTTCTRRATSAGPSSQVQETTGVLPPEVEAGWMLEESLEAMRRRTDDAATYGGCPDGRSAGGDAADGAARRRSAASSTPAQVRERKLGDLFEYDIEHPVTIRRNQSALVPIVLRPFEGRPVLLHNRNTRPGNPMRAVEFKNTTGLTLEGGPLTVLEGGSYVGEAMLDTHQARRAAARPLRRRAERRRPRQRRFARRTRPPRRHPRRAADAARPHGPPDDVPLQQQVRRRADRSTSTTRATARRGSCTTRRSRTRRPRTTGASASRCPARRSRASSSSSSSRRSRS